MSNSEKLRSMLDNLIDDKAADAQIDFHQYMQDKMKSIINIGDNIGVEDTPERKPTDKE